MFAALKRCPKGCYCPFLETTQLGCRLNGSIRCDVFNFSFLRNTYSPSFSMLLAVQSHKWSIEKKRVSLRRSTYIIIRRYYLILETRCDLKKLKEWSIAALANDGINTTRRGFITDERYFCKFHKISLYPFNTLRKWKLHYMIWQ